MPWCRVWDRYITGSIGSSRWYMGPLWAVCMPSLGTIRIIRTIRLPISISWRITKRYWRQRRMDKSMRDLGRRVGRSLSETAQFQENLKRRKDYFRRYRDLSIIITVGVYAISIIDAYVDAQLFDFDISPDLSLHWSPEVTPKTRYTPGSYGLNCSFKF